MEINKIFENILGNKFLASIAIIIISIIIYKIIDDIIERQSRNKKISSLISSRNKTYIRMIKNALKYIFTILTILVVLQVNNVNVSSILAGVGLIGAIIGLSVQDALKDIVRGISLVSDHYFSVGDVIKYKNFEGVVLVVGLKTTKAKSIINQNVIAIANRNIEEIEVISTQLDIEVPLSYDISKKRAEKLINEIMENINNSLKIEKIEYRGINKLDSSSINYLIRINCKPETKPQTKRDSLNIIIETLEKHRVKIPYTHIDVHNI